MKSAAARKQFDQWDSQPSLWSFVPPSPTDDVKRDLIAEMQYLAKKRVEFGVTCGEAVASYEARTGRIVGQDPNNPEPRDQRATSWLGRLGTEAGLRATNEVRRSPVKRQHGNRQTVYVWPSLKDMQR